ncbi:MAG: protein-glutamate O-methyltransferase CheR [Gemmatimonadota bacterium]
MPMTAQTFNYFRELVLSRSAIVLEPGKEYLVETRLAPLARTHGFATLDDLATRMAASAFSTMHRQAVEAMTTNETSFYRDIHPFESLRKLVLPEIIARKSAEKRLTFWCAASSTGQEPYSVAMLLRESFPELRDWKVEFLATDLSTAVLARAREGRYSQLEVNRGLPAALLVKYFTKDGTSWQVNESIRSMVEFRELNLIERWPLMNKVDIVFMRNVLIYFDIETKRNILKQVRGVMSPQGYLLLGSAETTMAIDDSFERVQSERGVTYRLTTKASAASTGTSRTNP